MSNQFFYWPLSLLGLSFFVSSHIPPWMSWHSEAVAWFAVMVLAWQSLLFQYKQDKNYRLSLPFSALPFLAFLAISTIQWGVGLVPWNGQVMVIFFYVIVCVVCLSVGFSEYSSSVFNTIKFSSTKLLTVLACSMLVVATGSVFITFCQAFSLWESSAWIVRMPDFRRPGGNMAQPNHLATLLVMGMASAAYLQVRVRWSAATTIFILLLLGAGLAATESRTGLLSLFVVLIWWSWKQPSVAPHSSRWGAVSVTAVLVAMFAAWPTLFNIIHIMGDGAIKNRLIPMSDSRFQIWLHLGEAALQKPWWGWGINQTAQAHNAIAHLYGVSAPFTFSHNLILDLAIWMGFPLTVLFVMAAAVWTWRRARGTSGIIPWYGLAIALPVAVHSMLEYPFAYVYFLAPVMLGLGAVEGALGGTSFHVSFKPFFFTLLMTTGLMTWSAVEYLRAEEDFRVVRFEMLRLGQTPNNYERPKILVLTQLGALLASIRLPIKNDMAASDLELLRTVALNFPLTTTEYRYAMALALNDNTAEAARQLEVMRAQHGKKNHLSFCNQIAHRLDQSKTLWRPDCSKEKINIR